MFLQPSLCILKNYRPLKISTNVWNRFQKTKKINFSFRESFRPLKYFVNFFRTENRFKKRVRTPRIELGSRPWQGRILPLNHVRSEHCCSCFMRRNFAIITSLAYHRCGPFVCGKLITGTRYQPFVCEQGGCQLATGWRVGALGGPCGVHSDSGSRVCTLQ